MKALTLSFVLCICFSCKDRVHIGSSIASNQTIEGSWVLYQYQLPNSSNLISKSDTLKFSSTGNYTYNNQSSSYQLYDANTGYRLTLNNTSFGDLTGLIPYNFRESQQVNGVLFSALVGSSNATKYYIWLKKI